MEYLVPILMCALFLFGCFVLCRFILFLYTFFTKRALLRAQTLDPRAAEALLSLYFGESTLYLARYFPYRTPTRTMYREIPCILMLGRRIFVLEFCPVGGILHNTDEETWTVTRPALRGRKKEIRIRNPILEAKTKADTLRELIAAVKLPFSVSVEPIAVLTAKQHRLDEPDREGICILPEALKRLRTYLPKNKAGRKRMQKENQALEKILQRYSVSPRQAAAKNVPPRQKKR